MKPVKHDYHRLFKPRRFGWGYDFNTRSKGGRMLARATTIAFVLYMAISIRHGKWAEDHQK
ncbi:MULTISPECIES: hypothetical protein [Furfurilactobacillus]|uniref:Uncharacterized protein n=2 Tax=Furfurilactobacillus TaxID=2767882 RepID=A0A6N9I5W1_9LACO|nr:MULTISPECIES: hypothetical protein [Furfurilactobacillus]MCF6161009.1 hypothetical protein [Furfurilactobacillus milii]MCF6163501.1 hypothetical protein [Furfurilactobacillus milii]MCF6164654.1 hypothetical protein [Furfurilactobacillus rossiae]MCF6418698.1 hypothetical protein [Furfurilactobacillus milii]MDF9913541.1 hypothetical protein [Furfurilactobacillus milii]